MKRLTSGVMAPLPHLRRIVLGVNSRITAADIFRIKREWDKSDSVEVAKAKIDNLSYKLKIETQLKG
jgi:hypothetical protein